MPRNSPDKKVSRFRRGMRSLPERQLNALVDGINRAITGVNAPTQAKPHGKGGGASVIVLTLVSHEDDYLVCQDENSNTVNVAKPYELRRTPFDGNTVNGVSYTYTTASEREATDSGSPAEEETQLITPDYVAGHEIFASKIRGGTGVQTGASPAEDIIYLEMNQGRAWAVEEV